LSRCCCHNANLRGTPSNYFCEFVITSSIHNLKNRVVFATAWVFASHFISQFLRFISNLILTRLLLPEMFGLMAIVNMLMFGLHLISDVGLRQNLIQSKRGHDLLFVNTVWSMQILRGVLISILGFGLALGVYLLSHANYWPSQVVYSNAQLPYLITVCALVAAIDGLASTNIATANRNLNLARISMLEFSSQIVGIVVMVGIALYSKTIWALVAGNISSSVVKVILSHNILPGIKNRFRLDRSSVKEILGFGQWIFLSSILGFLAAGGDRLILGSLVTAQVLGLYAIAFFIVGAIQEVFGKVMSSVAFPVLSEVVRDRPHDLKKTYYKFRLYFDIPILFATGLLFASGHWLIDFFYDERYRYAGHMLTILSVGLFEARYGLAGQVYLALGKPKYLVVVIACRVVALFVAMPLAFAAYGLNGALWVAGTSVMATLPATFFYKIQYKFFDLRRELMVLPVLLAGYGLGELINWAIHALGVVR
jgi:O-antigen/teichoic acid export membrane protein